MGLSDPRLILAENNLPETLHQLRGIVEDILKLLPRFNQIPSRDEVQEMTNSIFIEHSVVFAPVDHPVE